jgi:hypothetical protein
MIHKILKSLSFSTHVRIYGTTAVDDGVGVFVPTEITVVVRSLSSALDVGEQFAIDVIVYRLPMTPSLAGMGSVQRATWGDCFGGGVFVLSILMIPFSCRLLRLYNTTSSSQ